MARRVMTFIALLAMACASQPKPTTQPAPTNPTPAPPPPPTAAKTGSEAVRFGPSALRYVSHQVVHVSQEMQGMTQASDFGLRSFFRVTITGPADSAGYSTTVTVDSIVPDSGSTLPPGLNLGGAKGLSINGRLSPNGEFRNAASTDTTAPGPLTAQIISSFRNFFPRLPAGGATVGATWTDTVTSTERALGSVTVTNISRTHAAAWEQRNGTRCLRLDVTSNFTIQGSGEQFGQTFDISGTGLRSGVDYVAVDGRFMGGEAHDSTNSTISLPIQGMTIPRTQVSRSTVTVLP
jgi:hypothetical protein